jgi:uracil-DNA glycosylase family 4
MSINAPALSASHMRSLTDWLVLAGVSVEVGNQPAVYAIPAPDFTQAAEPAVQALIRSAVKPAATPQAALQIEKFKDLTELNNFCAGWKGLGLAKTAARAVLGQGKATTPALMVISDLPDDNEDRQGQAFSSTANQLVRQALTAAGVPEAEIYFTYLSKWRTPAKRALTIGERDICAQILIQEIGLVQPGTILTLGESTIRGLVNDFAQNLGKRSTINLYENQYLNKKLPLMASQKGEFLIKNSLMKKNFWFSILDLAAIIRP